MTDIPLFWVVGDDTSRYWSTEAHAWVSELLEGWSAQPASSLQQITNHLLPYGIEGPIGTVIGVKAEAARRIDAIMPDYKQRNVMAWGLETMMTYGADPAGWPPDLQAVNNQAQAAWAAIKAIRTRSDEIEAMDPIPAEFREDAYWN